MSKKVKLSQKASIFHDPTTGFTISGNEVKPIESRVLSSPKVRAALSSGHLIYEEVIEDPETVIKKNLIKLEALIKNGVTSEKISKSFKLADLKDLAKYKELELEKEDTAITISEALIELYNESSK